MKNAFSYCLPERAFFLRRAFVSHLLWMFFYSYDVCVLVYNRACCRRESSDIYRHRTASRAKQSTAQGSKPAQGAKHVRAYQSATTQQASRQSWLEPAYRRAFIVKALVRWATGKRLTNRLPKLSLITLSPPLNSGIPGRMGLYVPTPKFFYNLWGPRESDLSGS